MTPLESLRFAWLDASNVAALADLFAREGSPCYCRYWHFEGDKNAWLGRCAEAPDENRRELEADVAVGSPKAGGLVAIDSEGKVVAWMKLAPRATLPKLRRLPTYRSLDLGDDDAGVWAVGCFLIDPGWRRRGLARALVGEAVSRLRERGARAIEAYPREGVHAAEAWTGPPGAFEGFAQVAGEHPYPVLRLTL